MAAAMLAGIMTAHEDQHQEHMGTKDLLNLMPQREDVLLSSELEKCPFFSPGSNWRPLFCAATKGRARDRVLAALLQPALPQ